METAERPAATTAILTPGPPADWSASRLLRLEQARSRSPTASKDVRPGRDGLDAEVKSIATGTVGDRPIAVTGSADGTVRLWDLRTRAGGRLVGAHDAAVGAMAIGTARGQTVAISGGEDGDVRLWRLTESSPIGVSLGGRISNAVKTVAIGAAHGRDLALAGSDDGAIRLWDLATARLYGPGLTGPGTGPEALGICSLNARTTVLSGHWDGTLWTWSL